MFRVIKGEEVKSGAYQVIELPIPSRDSGPKTCLSFRGDTPDAGGSGGGRAAKVRPEGILAELSDGDAGRIEVAASLAPSAMASGAEGFIRPYGYGGTGMGSAAAAGDAGAEAPEARVLETFGKEGIAEGAAGPGVAVHGVIIDLAKRQAERLLDEARQKATSIEKDAWERGFKAGFKDGMSKSLEAGEDLLRQTKQILEDAKAKARRILEESRYDLVDLVITVASRLIRDEVNLKPDVITRLLDEAAQRLDGQAVRALRANPRDVVTLEENLSRLHDRWPGAAGAKVVPDRSIEAGGMIIESDLGTLDCTIDSQLAQMRAKLLESLESALAGLQNDGASSDSSIRSSSTDSKDSKEQGEQNPMTT